MTAMTIDTHKIADILQQKNFSEEQVCGLLEAVREAKLDSLVTKEYMKEYLDLRLEQMELKLTIRVGAMIIALGRFLKYFG